MIVLAVIALVGLVAAIFMPRGVVTAPAASPPERTAPTG